MTNPHKSGDDPSSPDSNAGAQWVNRFLVPIIDDLLQGDDSPHPRRCLQLLPDDETEARRLRELGWECDLLLDGQADTSTAWDEQPLVYSAGLPMVQPQRYSIVLSGYLGLWLADPATRSQRISELADACAPGGGILTAIGNRLCPLDLTGNAATLHGFGTRSLATLQSLENDFIKSHAFTSLRALPVTGHFGWNRARGPMKLIGRLLDWNWRHIAKPERRVAYSSPLNPVLMVWIQR